MPSDLDHWIMQSYSQHKRFASVNATQKRWQPHLTVVPPHGAWKSCRRAGAHLGSIPNGLQTSSKLSDTDETFPIRVYLIDELEKFLLIIKVQDV